MIKTYRNLRNENKYIDVKRTKCGHYMWRQKMMWDNGVVNFLGVRLHGRYSQGGFRRCHKATIDYVLEDYEVIS